MRDKSIKLITTFLVLLFLSSIFNFSPTNIGKNENFQITIKENKPKTSKFWDLTGSPIFIDDSDPSKNWSYTASHYDWCSGSGSWTDPYVIENVTIDGQGSGNCIEIKNSDAYFIIRNCSLYNSVFGIILNYCDNSTLSRNTVNNNSFVGIYLESCYNNSLSGNIARNNNYDGIFLGRCYNNSLSGNNISYNNQSGIYLGDSNNNMLSGNTASNNNYEGIFLGDSNNNTLSGNNASYNNQDGIYLANCNNNTLSGNNASYNKGDGIFLGNSYNNTLSGNTASNNNKYGISLGSSYNTLSGNTASNNKDHGIYVSHSNYNTLLGNNASNNNNHGIYLRYSINNTLSGNKISNNSYGIYLDSDSNDNEIFLNYFLNCTINAHDNGINNTWDNGFIGNYWSDYAGVDANHNGIGDTPYLVPGTAGSQDNFPICAPVIIIISPLFDNVFGLDAPNYQITINELNLDTIWYTLDGGGTNYTITSLTGTFNQTAWEALSEGNVTIRFYANDTLGRIGFTEVSIKKDITAPIITINNPQNNNVIGVTAPSFNISIEEPNLDKVWYSLNGGTNITFTGLTGTVNQTLWDALPEGNVTIRFYANDSAGNIGFQEVSVLKEISQTSPPGIPGYDLSFLFGIISVMVAIIIKKRINHLN